MLSVSKAWRGCCIESMMWRSETGDRKKLKLGNVYFGAVAWCGRSGRDGMWMLLPAGSLLRGIEALSVAGPAPVTRQAPQTLSGQEPN